MEGRRRRNSVFVGGGESGSGAAGVVANERERDVTQLLVSGEEEGGRKETGRRKGEGMEGRRGTRA